MKAWAAIPVFLYVIVLVAPLSADCESDYQDDTRDCESRYGMFDGDRMYRAGTCQRDCTEELARFSQCAVKGADLQWVRIPPGNCRSSR